MISVPRSIEKVVKNSLASFKMIIIMMLIIIVIAKLIIAIMMAFIDKDDGI